MTINTDRPKILIVEDNGPIVGFMNEILTNEGYCIIDIVATGREAIEIALDTRPDIILMDINLRGDMDGISAYDRIRETVEIPVVYVSAYDDEHVMARAKQHHCAGYIVKPFKIEQLITSIEDSLAWNKSRHTKVGG